MLVQCGVLYDVTRNPRTIVNCYELRGNRVTRVARRRTSGCRAMRLNAFIRCGMFTRTFRPRPFCLQPRKTLRLARKFPDRRVHGFAQIGPVRSEGDSETLARRRFKRDSQIGPVLDEP